MKGFRPDVKLTDFLKRHRFTISAEVIPPRNGSEQRKILEQVDLLVQAGAQFLSVTKGAGGSLRGFSERMIAEANVRLFSSRRFLAAYSGGLTAALMVVLLSGFSTGSKKKADFDEINVRRINIVEPDGTLRMTISNRAQFPGLIRKGNEFKHERPGSGILFFNDEGTENGGLVFGGKKDANGKTSAGGSLTFDQYEQDQVVQLWQQEEDGQRMAGLVVNDQPDEPADFAADAANTRKKTAWGPQRVFVGKNADRSALIALRDPQGRKRLVVQVAADGTPSLRFLDENGKIVSELPRKTKD